MAGNRCSIYACGKRAAYMVRHKQGMFGDMHFLLCKECAEALVLNLPPELVKFGTSNQEPTPMSTVEMVLAVIASPEVQDIAQGKDAPENVNAALQSLLETLAKGEDALPPESEEESPKGPITFADVCPNAAAMLAPDIAASTEALKKQYQQVTADSLACPICGAGPFKSKAALTGHMNAKHHGGPEK